MKINGKEIDSYNARLIDRVCTTQNINSITDWLDGAVVGTLLRQDYEYKSMKLTFVVNGLDEDDAYKKISLLTEAIKKCCIKFDDIDLVFPCVMKGAATPIRLQNGVFKIDYLLLNDWGIGETTDRRFDITPVDAQEVKVKYIESWAATAKGYAKCFDENEIYVPIAEETVYIDKSKVTDAAGGAESWNSFFLALGVDIDKYRKENYANGFVHIEESYDPENAVSMLQSPLDLEVYYNRFQKNGYNDLPAASFPSLVLMTKDNADGIYFDLGIGKDWDVKDISVNIWGRWFDAKGGGVLFGADGYYSFLLKDNDVRYYVGDNLFIEATGYKTSSSGGKIVIETLEDIDSTPLRKYGFKSSQDGAAAVEGFLDVVFNGVTLDRTEANEHQLQANISLMKALGVEQPKATYCEISRVQIFYQGELVKDLIPIAGNVKNGFVNDYSRGFYDINTFEFIPYTKANGDSGATPDEVMTIPVSGNIPTPPAPPTPKYIVTVVNGSGSGEYEAGQYVSIEADAAPSGKEFAGWAVTSGNVTIINPGISSTGFIMPEADVTVTAAYEAIKVTPEILLYSSLSQISSEDTMGANKKDWNSTIHAYDYFVAVYSVPNSSSGEWSIYNSSYYSMESQGKDKWGREYIEFMVTRGKSATGQYITHKNTADGTIRQDFVILSA